MSFGFATAESLRISRRHSRHELNRKRTGVRIDRLFGAVWLCFLVWMANIFTRSLFSSSVFAFSPAVSFPWTKTLARGVTGRANSWVLTPDARQRYPRAMSQSTRKASSSSNGIANDRGSRPLVIVVAGPTAVGKSDVAARLCDQLPGMIVSADSVQAYKGPQIGANKPTMEERQQTPHLLVDVADHDEPYNAAEWKTDAVLAIQTLTEHDLPSISTEENDSAYTPERQQIVQSWVNSARQANPTQQKSLVPVVCGGTMMYLQWLVHGRPDAMRPSPKAVEDASQTMQSYQDAKDYPGARKHVAAFGEVFAQRIQKFAGEDWYRLRRTLEVALTVQEDQDKNDESGNNRDNIIQQLYTGQRQGGLASMGYDVRCFFLCPHDRMQHTQIVDERCEQMITKGLIKETTDLQCSNTLPDMAARAIGYRQTLDYLQSQVAANNDQQETNGSVEEAFQNYLNDFTTATRRYAKKQMSWFRKDKDFLFVPVSLDTPKPDRVQATANTILELSQCSRADYEAALADPTGASAICKQTNEKQGAKMKFYQFQRHILKPQTEASEKALKEVMECQHRMVTASNDTNNTTRSPRGKRQKVASPPQTDVTEL